MQLKPEIKLAGADGTDSPRVQRSLGQVSLKFMLIQLSLVYWAVSLPLCLSLIIRKGAPVESPTITFGIEYDNGILRAQYCASNPAWANLSNNEFNYPDVKNFVELNRSVIINNLISQDLFEKLEQKASLQHFQNWRCKEYSAYKYHTTGYFLEVIYTSGSLIKHFRFEQPNITEIIKDKPSWTYKLLFNGSIYKELEVHDTQSEASYKVERELRGKGLHQQLRTTITFKKKLTGTVVVKDFLDVYTYVDKDELDKLPLKYKLMTVVDIERPQEQSHQHIVLHEQKFSQKITYEYPLHFRYHLAGSEEYQKSYLPSNAQVFTTVSTGTRGRDALVSNHFEKDYFRVKQKEEEAHLTQDIPAGQSAHKNWVFIVTVGVTLGMGLYVSRQIIRHAK